MTILTDTHQAPACTAVRWRCALRCGLLAFAVAGPALAEARTLDDLLRLPFERLLQLKISKAHAAPHVTGYPLQLACVAADGNCHVA